MMSGACSLMDGHPATPEELQAHRRHTLEAMIAWELIRTTEGAVRGLELIELRVKYETELDKTFPESVDLGVPV